MADIDLDTGERAGVKRARPSTGTSTRDTPRATPDKSDITDHDLNGRLKEVFTDVADWREKKEDTELAEAIRESHEDMAKGLVALTRTLKWLRGPLGFAVGFIKPVLAFGKVGRILGERLVTWRMNRVQEKNTPDSPYVNQ